MERILPSAIVSIDFSANMNNRLLAAVNYLLTQNCCDENGNLDQTKLNEIHKQIGITQDGVYSEEWINHYVSLLIIIKEFQDLAKAQGLTEEIKEETLQDQNQ